MRAQLHWLPMLVLASVTVAGPTAARSPEAVPLSVSPDGAIVVRLDINGAGRFRFLLDTGATRSVVGDEVAARLNLTRVGRTTVVTPTGSETRMVVTVPRVSIESTDPRDLTASVVPTQSLRAAAGVDGMLAQDFMRPHNYTIDYRRQRLVWTAAAGCRNAVKLTLMESEGRWLAGLADERSTGVRWLVPDSGTNSMVVFRRPGGPTWDLDRLPGSLGVAGVTGNKAAQPALLRELRIGRIRLHDVATVVIDRDHPEAPLADGLLPLHIFSSVSFDASGVMRICP
jgi:predicted aspartyl protease